MAGYNFKIEYRPGKENVITDALLRKAEDMATVTARHIRTKARGTSEHVTELYLESKVER